MPTSSNVAVNENIFMGYMKIDTSYRHRLVNHTLLLTVLSVSGFRSHRDDLVFVDPQQISNNYILPLHCAETETEHGQSQMTAFTSSVCTNQAKITAVLWNALEIIVNVDNKSISICALGRQLYLSDCSDSESVGSVVSAFYCFLLCACYLIV